MSCGHRVLHFAGLEKGLVTPNPHERSQTIAHETRDAPQMYVDLWSLPDGHPPVPGNSSPPTLPDDHLPVIGYESSPALPESHPRCPARDLPRAPADDDVGPAIQNPPDTISTWVHAARICPIPPKLGRSPQHS
jgi:hypothetical protein